MALAAIQAQRAARLQRQTAEQLVHDYAAFAAWSYQRHVNNALSEAGWQVLNPILHRETHMLLNHPSAARLLDYQRTSLAQCNCNPKYRAEMFFAFTLGADTMGTAGAEPDSAMRRWIHSELTARLRGLARTSERMALVSGRVHGQERMFAYGLMPNWHADTIVYGFTFDPATMSAVFADAFTANGLLPAAVTRGLPNDSILAVRVTTAGGVRLFASSSDADWSRAANDTVRTAAAGLHITAAVRPALAGQVLRGGRSTSGLLLALVLISAALAVVALRQLRRESELVRLRSDFVSSVSHELRTPLAQVRLFLETLRLGRFETEEQREWLLAHLDRETTRLGNLVDNVLQFSPAGHQPTPPPLEPLDVATEVGETVRAFAPLARSRRVEIRMELAPGLVAPLDRARFRQLVLNLLDNAVKYGPPGQTVTVGATTRGSSVRVSVADEGPGVPPAERERVWEPYFRGRSPDVRAIGGSGIGLSVVREAVERHGGSAWIDPNVSRGTTVIIEIPGLPATRPAPVGVSP